MGGPVKEKRKSGPGSIRHRGKEMGVLLRPRYGRCEKKKEREIFLITIGRKKKEKERDPFDHGQRSFWDSFRRALR